MICSYHKKQHFSTVNKVGIVQIILYVMNSLSSCMSFPICWDCGMANLPPSYVVCSVFIFH